MPRRYTYDETDKHMVSLYVLEKSLRKRGDTTILVEKAKPQEQDLRRARTSIITMTLNCNMSMIHTILTYNTNYINFKLTPTLS
jgi:hypothetical protein